MMKTNNYVDVHTHIEMPEFDRDRELVIKRSIKSGLSFICTVGTEPQYWIKALEIAAAHKNIYTAIGLHPHEAHLYSMDIEKKLMTCLMHPKCLMVGETGLDFYKNYSPPDAQKKAFNRQLEIAQEMEKPVMIHVRDAHKTAIEMLGKKKLSGIIHCFSGNLEEARIYTKMGFFLSIPGIITYKKATNIHEVVKNIPLDRLLTETDAPFLSPEPFRGKRNEPSFVTITLKAIAELKGITPEDAARTIYINTLKVFRLALPNEHSLAYKIRHSLYVNLTSNCTNKCVFCGKNKDYFVKGHFLKLTEDPSLDLLTAALPDDLEKYDEVVFCGYGEPTLRLEIIKKLSCFLKSRGVKKIRLNTDGLGNFRENRNILPELSVVVDSISISLNAADSETYNKICRPPVAGAFQEVVNFVLEAKKHINEVVVSAVSLPGLDINKIKDFTENHLKVRFRERTYDELG